MLLLASVVSCGIELTDDGLWWWWRVQERYISRHLKAIVLYGIGPSLKSSKQKELIQAVDQMKVLSF